MPQQPFKIHGIAMVYHYNIIDGEIQPVKLMLNGTDVLRIFDHELIMVLNHRVKEWEKEKTIKP